MFANHLINQSHAGLFVSVPQSCEHPFPKAWGSPPAKALHQLSPRYCKESDLLTCFLKCFILQLIWDLSFSPFSYLPFLLKSPVVPNNAFWYRS